MSAPLRPGGPERGGRPDRLFDAYAFDLDGTVYLGNSLLPGARRTIAELRRRERPVRFLSNNPTRDASAYLRKLRGLGVPVEPGDVVTSVQTMTRWIVEHAPDAACFPIAEAPLIEALREAGIRLSDDPAEIDLVIASFDRTFDYRKLQIAFDAIRVQGRARLIATNPDPYCPLAGGRGEPDAGAVIAAIGACTGAELEVCTGKPDPIMLRTAFEGLGIRPGATIMVGDRLGTDIRMALDAGAVSALVLTGSTRRADVERLAESERPAYVLERLDLLLPPEIWSERGWTLDADGG